MSATLSHRACDLCGDRSGPVIGVLGVCRSCLLDLPDETQPRVHDAHRATRRLYRLAEQPPRSGGGVTCTLCARTCRMAEGERGFCNLRQGAPASAGGVRLRHLAGRPSRGLLQWYRDPLPTNCVADWVCDGHRRLGAHNLAVFYASCTFNCLYCQNWHFREVDPVTADGLSANALARCATAATFCACFFGGDPASQMAHALAAARRLAERGVRICWETNGSQNPRLFEQAVELSLATGGTLKIDLKALDDRLHRALTGADNRRTLANFEHAARRASERRSPPLVVASTLLVPGYVTPEEVAAIARFVASVDPATPYALLAFAPRFVASDLPHTSPRHAREAEAAARAAGLRNVRIGNRHLLADDRSPEAWS